MYKLKTIITSIVLCLCSMTVFAQTSVTGNVSDVNGEAVIGASIVEKGTTNGTVTDIDGNFTMNVSQGATLQISYIGYITQEVAVTGRPLTIILEEDTQTLDEVVVVGYGTMRKRDLTGSIVQIRPDRLANERPKTVQDVLRGTPGLQVGYDASAKGGGSMVIRGKRSVYEDDNYKSHSDPLIVLDGMIFYGELSEINPDDIGQIDILKDASSAAIYGAKAANGVIIITTKKGKRGKPVVNFNSSISLNTKSAYREVFGPQEYIQHREDWFKTPTYGLNTETGRYEAYQSGSLGAGYYDHPANIGQYGITLEQWRAYTNNVDGDSDLSIYAKRLGLESAVLENYLAGKTFDWYDHTFRTGINQDYSASVSGASENINYYMSLGYLNAEGAVKGNDYSTVRANLKVDGKVTDWLEIGANINFQDRTDGDIQVGLGTNYWDTNQLRNSPYSNYRNADGSLAQYPMGTDKQRGYNFDFERQYMELEKGYTVFNTIFNAKVTLPFDITYSFNASPRYQFFYDRYHESATKPNSNPANMGPNREQSKRLDWSLNNTVTWDKTLADRHRFILTLVQEAEERRYWMDRIEARDMQPSDALGFHNTQIATKERSNFRSQDEHETADALLARLFYSYDDRYMITTSVRRDGYSAFGRLNPHATFPSIAGAWTFTNEEFFNWEPMSMGKLRVSYGEGGNRSLPNPYLALPDLVVSLRPMGYITASGTEELIKALRMDRMGNSNLRWEKSVAFNVGMDFGFLNDRINGSIEYYKTTTTDMIMPLPLPGFSGFSSVTTNLGKVQNSGLELILNTLNISNHNFEWRTSLGFSYNKNRIKNLFGIYSDITDASGNVIGRKENDNAAAGWFIDQPISAIWDYRVTGIWQIDEIEEAAKYGQKPGDPKVANNYTEDDRINEDGSRTPVYNERDKEFLGQTSPPIHWSLRNEFTLWKNLDISFSLYSYMGHKSLSGNYLNGDNAGSLFTYNFNVFAKEYWTPDNPTNKYGRLAASGPSGIAGVQKLYNRSFIRFDNISVGYTLPNALTDKINLERVKVYGTVRNVGTWQKDWEYGDPETGGLATRSFTLGLNVTF